VVTSGGQAELGRALGGYVNVVTRSGTNSMREMPRYVRLIERGLFDAKSMITNRYSLDKIMDAYEAVAYRTTVTAMIVMA